MTAWAVADPMLSGPDEPAHVIRAEAIVRGQLVGAAVNPLHDPGYKPGAAADPNTWVLVPGVLHDANSLRYWCYIFFPDTTASCTPPMHGPAHDVRVETYVGHYPPLYYAVVGLPSLADPGPPGIIGMRLVSALLNSALLAVALAIALRRCRLAALGVLVAATPTVVYYGASVNPNGLEMSAAICFFTALLTLVLPSARPPTSAHLLAATASGCLLALARGLSPVWVAMAVAAALLVGEPERLRSLARRRAARAAAAVLALALAAAIGWIVGAHALLELVRPVRQRVGELRLVQAAFAATPHYLAEMIGIFGANNVPAPPLAVAVVVALFALLVLGALAVGSARERLVLVALLAAIVVVPVAADIVGGRHYGFIWQGRYTLPIGAGSPILAGLVLARRLPDRVGSMAARIDGLVLPASLLLGAAQFACLWWDLRRFMVGANGPLSGVFQRGLWQPPLPGPVLLVLALAGAAVVSLSPALAQRTRLPATSTTAGWSP